MHTEPTPDGPVHFARLRVRAQRKQTDGYLFFFFFPVNSFTRARAKLKWNFRVR